jgi:hypothetical protein
MAVLARRFQHRMLVVALGATVVTASGCGDSGSDASAPSSSAPTSTQEVTTSAAPDGVDGLTATVVLTRQRDLVGRGFVNVQTQNTSGHDLHVIGKELRISHFTSPGPNDRSSSVRDGRTINLQTAYGEAGECDDDTPVAGVFWLQYTVDDDAAVLEAEIPIDGTEVLDTIRAQRCTEAAAVDSIDFEFGDVTTDGDNMTVSLNISHRAGGDELTVSGFKGTVLFGVEAAPGSLPAVSNDAQPSMTVPLQFRVNRCDPHGLGETTLKYAVQAYVSVDGGDPVPVALDVDPLISSLDEILQYCVDTSETE